MCFSFVRPVLEYSGTVWDNCSNEDKKYIESIQIEATRIVTGATKLCSIAKLYEDTRWETLQVRRNRQKLIIFYKMVYGLDLCSYYTNPQGLFTQLFFSISFLRRLPDTALKVTS